MNILRPPDQGNHVLNNCPKTTTDPLWRVTTPRTIGDEFNLISWVENLLF